MKAKITLIGSAAEIFSCICRCHKPRRRSGILLTVITPTFSVRSTDLPDITIEIHQGGKVPVHIDPKDVFGKDLVDVITADPIDKTIVTSVLSAENADGSYDLDVVAGAIGTTTIPVTDGTNLSTITANVVASTVTTIVLTPGAEVAA